MQENQATPRAGLVTLIAHERKALTMVQSITTTCAELLANTDDTVVIRWAFVITDTQGVTCTLDELAWQQWRGEKILTERFYYDSAWRTR